MRISLAMTFILLLGFCSVAPARAQCLSPEEENAANYPQ